MADQKKPEEQKKEPAPKSEVKAADVKVEAKPAETAKEAPKKAEEVKKEDVVKGDFVVKGVALKPGLTIRVHQRLKEGDKSRVQVFEGMVISLRGATPETKTMTVRKVTSGVGVEKIYPLNMPSIEKVELVKEAHVRHSKLYFLREYKKKLRETLFS